MARKIPGVDVSLSDRKVVFPNGGMVGIRSADNPDTLRGEGLDFVVMDEAAYISRDVWTGSIRPSLSDRQGRALFISTPRGLNWFWELYQREKSDPDWASFTYPTSANPYIAPSEIEAARQELPEIIFNQEYLADFVDSEGAVFRRIRDAAVLEPSEPLDGHQYSAGVDVAASVDYTVITVLDVNTREMVYFDRFNRVDYPVLEDRLLATYRKWHLDGMVVEANSIGAPVIDHLREHDLNIISFTTTNTTKHDIIQRLQSAFEHGLIKIIDDPVLVGELLSFESKRTPSGNYTYSAPEGQHDDCVMSLAFAWFGITNDTWLIS
jgi:phage terminase large subunit-like protein